MGAMNELKDSGWLIYTKKANGYSKYYLVSDLDEPNAENQHMDQNPNAENQHMDQKPNAENQHMDQEAQIPSLDPSNTPNAENMTMAETPATTPNAENPDQGFATVRKPACINKPNSLNKTNLYKGQRDFAEEGKQKSKQESIDNLSARWTVNEVVNQYQ